MAVPQVRGAGLDAPSPLSCPVTSAILTQILCQLNRSIPRFLYGFPRLSYDYLRSHRVYPLRLFDRTTTHVKIDSLYGRQYVISSANCFHQSNVDFRLHSAQINIRKIINVLALSIRNMLNARCRAHSLTLAYSSCGHPRTESPPPFVRYQ